jgi:hypothetical protein
MDSMMLSTSYGATSEGLDSFALNGGMMDLDMAVSIFIPVCLVFEPTFLSSPI